jgi:hypothetical protein
MRATPHDVIVNFNYDYYFLRKVFPDTPQILVVNDNHWTAPGGLSRNYQVWALRRTLVESDLCIAVSSSLVRQTSGLCETELFQPWADEPYAPVTHRAPPDTLLYWGFINDRIDWAFLSALSQELGVSSPETRIMLVGPLQCSRRQLAVLHRCTNIELQGASRLSDIDLSRVLAGLIPYRLGDAHADEIEVPNKLFSLIARGLPILITGMPNHISPPFVFRLDAPGASILETIAHVRKHATGLQSAIRQFVEANSGAVRLKTFMSLVARAKNAHLARH